MDLGSGFPSDRIAALLALTGATRTGSMSRRSTTTRVAGVAEGERVSAVANLVQPAAAMTRRKRKHDGAADLAVAQVEVVMLAGREHVVARALCKAAQLRLACARCQRHREGGAGATASRPSRSELAVGGQAEIAPWEAAEKSVVSFRPQICIPFLIYMPILITYSYGADRNPRSKIQGGPAGDIGSGSRHPKSKIQGRAARRAWTGTSKSKIQDPKASGYPRGQ